MFSKKHKQTVRRPPVWVAGVLGFLLVFLVVFGVWVWQRTPRLGQGLFSTQTTSGDAPLLNPLNGLPVDEVHPQTFVYGVMIDGHADARPLSGIQDAFLVIEAPVEAGIPRMLAFFSEEARAEEIGPVRSARPYFIDWAQEFGALYVHVGGSDEALEKIKHGSTFDLNEFWHGDQFWRAPDRIAPHSTFTSSERLGAYVQAKKEAGLPDSVYGFWTFASPEPKKAEHSSVEITFTKPSYVFQWKWDAEKSAYVRVINSLIQKTADGTELMAQNIAVMSTDISVIDSVGRRSVRTLGEGEGFLFQQGVQTAVRWKKESAADRLRFFTEEGKEVKWIPGSTWIEVVSDLSAVSVK